MKKESCSGLVIILIVLLLSGCNKDYNPSIANIGELNPSENKVEKLPRDLQTLSEDDARTVAVGQIMRYFEYPSSAYNWSAMPNSTSNTTLSSFLATLRTELNVDDDGGTTDYAAKNTLQSYGYAVTIQSHSSTNAYSSLSNNRPVYMSGDSNTTGHAWVCDGFYNSYGYDEYKLYVLRVLNGQPHDFAEWESDRVYEFGPTMFHMNWGWGGSDNGYYLDSSVHGYSGSRKDLFISIQ